MLEKDSRPQAPDSVLPASCHNGIFKEPTTLECPATETNSYNYPLDDIPQTDSDLSFFGNDQEDKESSDLLYYGWPDIGNLEDVDRIFRGVGDEDDLGWFSSSNAFEGPEDALKLEFEFPESSTSKSETNDDPTGLKNASCSTNNPNYLSSSTSHKVCSWQSENDDSATQNHLSFFYGINRSSHSKEQSISKKQSNLHKKQPKDRKQSDGKRKDACPKICEAFQHTGHLWNASSKLPSGCVSHQYCTPIVIQKHKQELEQNSFDYLNNNPDMYPFYGQGPLEQSTVSSTLSSIRSEYKGISSPSRRKSSHASNQVQSIKNSHDPSCGSTAVMLDDKRDDNHQQDSSQLLFPGNSKHTHTGVQSSICYPISIEKDIHSKNKLENQSDTDGTNFGIPAELNHSNTPEMSTMSSGLDEISLEATSFRQLQVVIEKLDLKTKLCIRDSLYRLARSAEQRHDHVSLSGWSGDDRETHGSLIDEGENRCTGFVNVETDTNPIDRSIAHLLFHRPSDLPSMSACEALSQNSQTTIQGSIPGQPV